MRCMDKLCYYCGLTATGIDHVVPRNMLKRIGELDLEPSPLRVLKVPCCKECNNLLGGSYDESLLTRKRRLRQSLKRKYAKILKHPKWGHLDRSGIGYTLDSHLAYSEQQRVMILNRLAWKYRK